MRFPGWHGVSGGFAHRRRMTKGRRCSAHVVTWYECCVLRGGARLGARSCRWYQVHECTETTDLVVVMMIDLI